MRTWRYPSIYPQAPKPTRGFARQFRHSARGPRIRPLERCGLLRPNGNLPLKIETNPFVLRSARPFGRRLEARARRRDELSSPPHALKPFAGVLQPFDRRVSNL